MKCWRLERTIDRIALAHKRESILRPLAKEQQIRKPESVLAKLPKQKPIDTRKECAKLLKDNRPKRKRGGDRRSEDFKVSEPNYEKKPSPYSRLYIEAQTVESTIRAYGAGEIQLPEVDAKTNEKHLRYADKSICQHPYTEATLAKFLGWQTVDKAHPEGRPNHACKVAFQMLDADRLPPMRLMRSQGHW